MKRLAVSAMLFLLAVAAWAQSPKAFGTVNYVENTVSIVRAGKPVKAPADIGDQLFPDDMIKTAGDSYVVIDLDKSTGMSGTLTIKPGSVVYLRLSPDATKPRSTIELIAGQIGSKLSKISGSPTFQVSTESTVMGVRGTTFGVSAAVNGSILITCTEGMVTANDGTMNVEVPAGKAAEKKPAERLRLVPVSVSTMEQFEASWFADAIEAFRADPAKALRDYEKRYTDLSAKFATAFDPLQRSEVLSKWLREDSEGKTPASRSAEVPKEKKAIIGTLLEVRKVLFLFERIYYRLVELSALVSGTTAERQELRAGFTVGDFLRKLESEAGALERKVNLFRQAERLYALRNEGSADLPGSSSSSDFFGSSDGWDF